MKKYKAAYSSQSTKLNEETLLFKPLAPKPNAIKVTLGFPNTYTIGITSLGFQVIWASLAQREDVDVRRVFTDVKEKLHRKSHLFGVSLSWELDAPNILNLLEKQNIPLWSNERDEEDPIVFGGGPVLTANPEPLAPFFDVILLGDGEELLPIFLEAIKTYTGLPRYQVLCELSKIPGIYIPILYEPKYSSDGELINIEPVEQDIPQSIRKQTWRGKNLCHSTVITPNSAWPNIHMVEVVRSCPELCRFCLASYLTLPFRTPSIEEGLIPAIEKGLQATKRIGLLGASITQHPEFSDLLEWFNQDKYRDIRLSLSSVRASTVNSKLTNLLVKYGSKSITIAIESGSERIRKVINKKLLEEEIFAAAKYTHEAGLSGLKLYGMVGLPTEENCDVELTADLLLRLKQATKGLRLTLGISAFVPKSHTPFQWMGFSKDAKKRLQLLNKKLRSNNIETRPESLGFSIIQTLISRSDRRLAPVIEAIYKNPNQNIGTWKKAYIAAYKGEITQSKNLSSTNIMPHWEEIIYNTWEDSKILPWNHIHGPLTKNQLLNHKNISFN